MIFSRFFASFLFLWYCCCLVSSDQGFCERCGIESLPNFKLSICIRCFSTVFSKLSTWLSNFCLLLVSFVNLSSVILLFHKSWVFTSVSLIAMFQVASFPLFQQSSCAFRAVPPILENDLPIRQSFDLKVVLVLSVMCNGML